MSQTATMKSDETITDRSAMRNGLDLAAVEAARAALAADPAKAAVSFQAATRWAGGLRTRTEIAGHELGGVRFARRHAIATDEPSELLGGDSAPNPQDLILSALNSCMVVGFVVGATARGIHLDALDIESDCTLDLRGAFGIDPSVAPGADCIRYTIRARGSGTPEQFEEIHREVMERSPNRFHLARPVRLESRLVVG